MNTYADGTDVTLTIPFVDLNGDAVAPTALVLRVLDEDENEVSAASVIALPNPVGSDIEISIEGSDNTLPVDALTGVRTIEAVLTTPIGEITLRESYMIAKSTRLVVLRNSFQTWGRAQMEANDIPNLIGWATATNQERQTALIEAYRRITRLGFLVQWPRDVDDQRYLVPDVDRRIAPKHWAIMNTIQWQTFYPEIFRAALRRAQIVEADQIIGGDRVSQKRRSGVLSETIGESAMAFRNGKPLDLGVSAAALEHLKGFVDIRMTTTRS